MDSVEEFQNIHNNNADDKDDLTVEENNLDVEDSDSDSDVIYVERNENEIIELSDEENESAEYIKSLNLPDDFVNSLKQASNRISLKLGEYVRNKMDVNSIITEIPNKTWSVPWKAVTQLFNNPNNVAPVNKKRSKNNYSSNLKRKLHPSTDFISKNSSVVDSKVNNIKQEKMSEGDDYSRNLSVVQFDSNKPPEFCEVSRSGRIIKKPSRLKDNLTFFNRANKLKRKKLNNENKRRINDEELADDNVYISETYIDNTLNNIDSDSLDRVILSDSDDSEIQDSNNWYNFSQSHSSDNQSISDESNSQNDLPNRRTHNLKEKERRYEIKSLFELLRREITSIKPETEETVRYSYMKILTEAFETVKQLETSLKGLKETANNYIELNKLLEINLENRKAEFAMY